MMTIDVSVVIGSKYDAKELVAEAIKSLEEKIRSVGYEPNWTDLKIRNDDDKGYKSNRLKISLSGSDKSGQ